MKDTARLVASWALGASAVFAGTNTPFPVGTDVAVTTSAGTVSGTLLEAETPDWIGLREPGAGGPTFVRGDGVVVRRAPTARGAAARPASHAAAPAAVSRSGHFVYGQPRATDDRFRFRPPGAAADVGGLTIHVREAFTLGHYNRMKVPAWVAMRWTAADLAASEAVDFDRPPFKVDAELPVYARTGKDFDFDVTKLEKGHMARDADLEAWGTDAVAEGMRMSNIVPQRQGRNHAVWGKLEDEHRNVVADSGIEAVWVVSGPFYDDTNGDGVVADDEVLRVGDDGVAVPAGTYKVITWEDGNGGLAARAYMIRQDDAGTDLTEYLVSVDAVEAAVGLDFLPDLEDPVEGPLEAARPTTLWDR